MMRRHREIPCRVLARTAVQPRVFVALIQLQLRSRFTTSTRSPKVIGHPVQDVQDQRQFFQSWAR